MAEHIELGKRGEQIAVDYLREENYQILQRNYRARRGEIDIVARDKKKNLVFFEVKARINFERPEEAVNEKKVKILMETIENYKFENNIEEETFLDIIAINFTNKIS